MQELKTKTTITKEINTKISDPGRTTLKEDKSLETRPKQTDGNVSRNFEIRSFSKAQETSNWEICQLGSDNEPNKPQSKGEVVVINSNISTETEVTSKQKNPRPQGVMNSGFGSKEEIRAPIPKKRSSKEIRVMNITNKQTTPTTMEELSIDLNVKKDPGILEDVKTSPVNNVNVPVCVNLDQKSLDPVQKEKEKAVQEIMVSDFKRSSPTRTEELSVDSDVRKDPDILEGPVNNLNIAKCVDWDQESLDPEHKGKERAVEEIIVADIKRRSPTRKEELKVELNLDITEDLDKGPVHKDVHKDENRLEDMNRDELQESVMKNKNEAAEGKSDFDEELRKSESTNEKESKGIEEISGPEPEGRFQDENGISESNILASVYARATRPKSDVSKTPFAQDPVQKTVDVIPTIVIVPSDFEEPKEVECKCLQVHYFRGKYSSLSLPLSRACSLFFPFLKLLSIQFHSLTPQEHTFFVYIHYPLSHLCTNSLALNYYTVSDNPVEALVPLALTHPILH